MTNLPPSFGNALQQRVSDEPMRFKRFPAVNGYLICVTKLKSACLALLNGAQVIGLSFAGKNIQICSCLDSLAAPCQRETDQDSLGQPQRLAFARALLTPGAAGFFIPFPRAHLGRELSFVEAVFGSPYPSRQPGYALLAPINEACNG